MKPEAEKLLRERKTIMKSVGERIAELRKEKNMTQEALAAALNVSSQAISKWENNATMPDISLLPRIADAFDVTVDDLFGRRTKPPKYIRSVEELPVWIYDLILNNMWDDDMPPRKESFAECVKKHWQTHPNSHSGFVRRMRGQSMPARIWLFPICRVQRIPCGYSKARKPANFCNFWLTRPCVPC